MSKQKNRIIIICFCGCITNKSVKKTCTDQHIVNQGIIWRRNLIKTSNMAGNFFILFLLNKIFELRFYIDISDNFLTFTQRNHH